MQMESCQGTGAKWLASVRHQYRETDEFERQAGKALYSLHPSLVDFHAMATLEGHSKPVIVLTSAAKHGYFNLNREKAPVQSSHRSSTEHGGESPGRKTRTDRPQCQERFCESGAISSPLVCRLKRTPHHASHPWSSNDSRRENDRDRTEKESPSRKVHPLVLRQTSHPPRFVDLSMMLSAAPVEIWSQDMLLRIRC